MFVTGFVCSMSLSGPCLNKVITPAGPVIVPMINVSMSCVGTPNILNIYIGGLLAQNVLTLSTSSAGSEVSAPSGGGVVSQAFCSLARATLGSFKFYQAGAPAKRFLDPTGQNGLLPNSYGLTITMGIFNKMVMT
ncbi:DUF4150 domain-containing protein [Pseudomonadales bacterium]|nr:DUF4150 domain-containing protein [Pseudomonadales bacterium]